MGCGKLLLLYRALPDSKFNMKPLEPCQLDGPVSSCRMTYSRTQVLGRNAMHRPCRRLLSLTAITLAVMSFPAFAQVVVATAPTGSAPSAVALNPVTNKTYVANYCGDDPNCQNMGTVTVVDGATNNVTTVTVGYYPTAVAVNSTTNQIYVTNYCGTDPTCQSGGTVTVIDGATNNTSSVLAGYYPSSLAVNSATNKIYAANYCGNDANCLSQGTVTVIDAAHNNNTTTVAVGDYPEGVAVNSVTNKIYVPNLCGNDFSCSSAGTTTIIDGASNNTTTIPVGASPYYVALNSTTNKVYIDNYCGNDPSCASLGTVTVIDANNNNSTATVNVGYSPNSLAVSSATNQIYVANICGNDPSCSTPGNVTVIDGTTNNTSAVTVAWDPYFVGIDTAANQIYVVNNCGNDVSCASPGTVTVIDGASQTTFPIAVGNAPNGIAVNSSTHSVYIPNASGNNLSVIGGNAKLQFVPVAPCRVVDTRNPNGTFGGPALQADSVRNFPIPQGACGIPSTAAVYSLNVTAVPPGPLSYLTIWPAGQSRPLISTLNSPDGRTKANAAMVPAGTSGAVSVYVTNTTDAVIDIDGYFQPANASTLQFYPLTPCRVLDTRNADGSLGGPYLQGGQERDFPVQSSNCQIPSSAQAYSLNLTAVPYQGSQLSYLTVWPQGSPKPVVSTLNNPAATIVANAAIVSAGTGGGIAVYPSNNTQFVADINGYFAPAESGGLSLYPTVPCRALDTRPPNGSGPFSGTMAPPMDVLGSPCGVPSQSLAYVFNATAVPMGVLGYLTLWPDGGGQPVVSTLNAYDGVITSNMAIVEAGTQGKIDAYASGTTDLIMDISSFFAP